MDLLLSACHILFQAFWREKICGYMERDLDTYLNPALRKIADRKLLSVPIKRSKSQLRCLETQTSSRLLGARVIQSRAIVSYLQAETGMVEAGGNLDFSGKRKPGNPVSHRILRKRLQQ